MNISIGGRAGFAILAWLAALGFAARPEPARAAPPVVYSRQALPILRALCWGCHSGPNPASGYGMETREKLLAGGRHGAAILPGKGAQSALVRYLTGDLQPKMPPTGALDLDKIALLRRWIDEGAKVDSTAMPAPAPALKTPASLSPNAPISASLAPAPATALAFAPDGKFLAVGGYRVVRLLDVATGTIARTIPVGADQTQALAWSGDGKWLAVAGGTPGQSGEIVLLDTQTWRPTRTLTGHEEVVCCAAWRPGAHELATGSLDKTARIWNADTGQCTHIIKDHAEAVFGVAYSPDGKLLATGSGDRSAKIFDTGSWQRLAALTAHEDGLTRVAFSHDGKWLATASSDKTVRVWPVKIGAMENPQHTLNEGGIIADCAFSPDGSLLVYGASNHVVKVFSEGGAHQAQEWKDADDWVYAVAIAPDNQTVAAGTQDGKALLWDVKAGRLRVAITLRTPPAPDAKAAVRASLPHPVAKAAAKGQKVPPAAKGGATRE